jgi:predicted transcriptional regulator
MSDLKTKKNDKDILEFLNSVENPKKRADSLALFELFKEVTDEEPSMWGDNIVGFGEYHYKYDSKREGDWMLSAFSPRKAYISVYIMPGFKNYGSILDRLGKHKTSKGSCLYINKLADVDIEVLKELITTSIKDMKEIYS